MLMHLSHMKLHVVRMCNAALKRTIKYELIITTKEYQVYHKKTNRQKKEPLVWKTLHNQGLKCQG